MGGLKGNGEGSTRTPPYAGQAEHKERVLGLGDGAVGHTERVYELACPNRENSEPVEIYRFDTEGRKKERRRDSAEY